MSNPLFLLKRALETGPENPAEIMYRGYQILETKRWEFKMANGLGCSLSGAIVLFLTLIYFWRPMLVNRVSLRLIFAISIYDFIECLIQSLKQNTSSLAECRSVMFFSSFFGYASVYTSSSIAANLYINLIGKGLQGLPKYVEWLYFTIPLLVSLINWAPPIIWAAKHGYCSAFEPIEQGTRAYIIYVVFVQLLLPLLSLLFNIYVSIRILVMLALEQRQIIQSLEEINRSTRELLLLDSPDNSAQGSAKDNSFTDISRSKESRRQLEKSLLVMKKFNSAAIRIALYPCAPISWWVINCIYYTIQYKLTMTFGKDVNTLVYLISLAWFSIPAIAFANFLVFVTDPAFVKVLRQVRISFIGRCSSKMPSQMAGRSIAVGKLLRPSFADYSDDCETVHLQSIRCSFESKFTCGNLEKGRLSAYSSATLTNYSDLVKRHPTVGNGAEANIFYSKI
ncbi:hypothetical protein H4R99_007028 [Coemansia sp. RSA 1722]|nr:hypothetical protein H4R99_007028 [Coemansia sp. RSA 1722]